MQSRMSRREALKLGTNVAVSTAMTPLFSANPVQASLGVANAPESSADICFLRAVDMAKLIREKKLSAREVMQAHLKQISRVNSKVNAMVTLVAEEQLMAQAAAADESLAKEKSLGPLHGIPVGAKDLHETAGIRTTYGSPLHRDFVPDFDCCVVQREKAAGAIVIGKTNVPEFGLGSQTFNPVFGATRNPYDLTKTCGGSTGGGVVALACGMVPLADGSDMGGSLRNPPNFGARSQRTYESGVVHAFGSGAGGAQCHGLRVFPQRSRRLRSPFADFHRAIGRTVRAAAGAQLQGRARGDVQGFGAAVGCGGKERGRGAGQNV